MSGRYIVADNNNHCLREIQPFQKDSRQLWETGTFAGVCGSSGDVIGQRLASRFNNPRSLVISSTRIYITDYDNYKIKQLDLVNDEVSLVYQSVFRISHILVGANDREFYATAPHGVLLIQNQAERWLLGSRQDSAGLSKGRFSEVRFHTPLDLQWLDDTTLVVADRIGDTIKFVDLESQNVQTVCTSCK